MLISDPFKQNILILANTDTENNSINIDSKTDTFKLIPKRTKTQNLRSRALHTLSFSSVARNDKLDRVTEYIFSEIQYLDLNRIKLSEKLLLKKALRKLEEIIETNEGSNLTKVQELYDVIDKINILETFQILIS